MSNNVIPNFLPPPYDFITEEDDEEWSEGPCACKIFYGTIFALVVYRLIDR